MVFKTRKFICGCGEVDVYVCEICGSMYLRKEDAEECEKRHRRSDR